jgi:hypothetical protein
MEKQSARLDDAPAATIFIDGKPEKRQAQYFYGSASRKFGKTSSFPRKREPIVILLKLPRYGFPRGGLPPSRERRRIVQAPGYCFYPQNTRMNQKAYPASGTRKSLLTRLPSS